MDRIGDLTLFLRVLDLGSISAAARSLNLSVAVVSQRLKRLEKELGVRLLHRSTRRLHATPEGLALAEQGRPLIEDLDALTVGLRQTGSDVTGTLRLTTSATFGRMYISPLLPEFLSRYPQIKVSLNLTDLRLDLVSAGLDLAIRIGESEDSSLVARAIGDNRRTMAASPDFLRKYGMPTTPEELAERECLILVGSQGRNETWQLIDPSGEPVSVRVQGRIDSNFGEVLRDAALAGLGIGRFSNWHIHEDLRSGRLVRVMPNYSSGDSNIYAVMPQRRLVPARVRAFVAFLEEHFGTVPPWEREPDVTN